MSHLYEKYFEVWAGFGLFSLKISAIKQYLCYFLTHFFMFSSAQQMKKIGFLYYIVASEIKSGIT